MTKKFAFSLFALLLIFAVACRKDDVITDVTMEEPPPVITIQTSVLGLVTDLDGNAIEGATLTMGSSQTTSDENGYFGLNGAVDSKNAIIKVEMFGYFDSWHSFHPFEDDLAKTQIRLTPRNNPMNVSANDGGEISFENVKINFHPGSFVDEGGNTYSGNVSVFAKYLDPTDPNLNEIMPGNLTAFNATGGLRLLQTFGMVNVELEGESGQKLQINKPATLEMPVPASILTNAPNEIPLWYFDTEKERWQEEGNATLEGGKYIGTVEHFTFWNCDVPMSFVNITGQVLVGSQTPVMTVCLTRLDNNDQRCTKTSTTKGLFGGKVPKNQEFLLEIISPCGDVVFSTNVGPFTDDEFIGPFTVTFNQAVSLVHGTVTDCDGNAVSAGYVLANWGTDHSEIFNLNPNGTFSQSVFQCGASDITLTGVDLGNLKKGDPQVFAMSSDVDAGTLEACVNDVEQGMTIEYGGNIYVIPDVTIQSPVPTGSSGDAYQMLASDNQGNGNKILYEVTVIDWTGQPNSEFAMAYAKTIIGAPDVEYDFTTGDIQLLELGQNPGEFVIFEITDIGVSVDGGISYTNGTINITALIQ